MVGILAKQESGVERSDRSTDRPAGGGCCRACGRPFDTEGENQSDQEFKHRRTMLSHLSESQIQVLGYLLMGHTEPQIAALLHRSRHTIHDHTKAIYAICGVARRVHLVQAFRGVLPEDLIAGHVPPYLK
jgi:DNA-binding NarL/FixJ family response regulator